MRRIAKFASCVAAVILVAAVAQARVAVPDVISDGMVLQRDAKVPIWGTADPGESITVRFARQTKKTTAGTDGRWRVELSNLDVSDQPQSLTIAGANTIEIKDVLVGEVWLVAGQSNMQLTLPETANGDAAVAAANDPLMRLFNVSRKVAFHHADAPLGRWLAASPESVKDFSAAGYYFGVELRRELRVPIGIINSSYGGSQAEAWTPVEDLLANPDLKACVEREKIWNDERPRVQAEYDQKMTEWRAVADKAKQEGTRPPRAPAVPDALREYRIAASIYNGMIAPLIPLAIRGAIWYQGESNEERAQQYGILLPVMIRAWRERWGEGDFPFAIVQLPNYRDPKPEPVDEAWSFVREAQRRTAISTRNSGLIVTIDIGEAHDIHPKDKLDVGKRMARWALADAYRRKITASGPMFRSARPQGSKMVVTFSDAGKGLRLRDGDKLDEFAIAGADRQWHWANAKIAGKDRVEAWSDSVRQPVAVRYAFNNNPRHPNLTNETGLPASPFRSDDWPGPTDGKR
jgi:sialate O-acetylesterase